ncbi:urease accessory protein UreD [Pseudomonas sp. GD03860]|uniref:urease accessory protein UreD n=1 Tax=Pseudomonas TaxID=286 RepID=UPI00236365B8|nr:MULTISPECIES: urease accessory protein UreD [Pseudomonas]MDD2058803.1 urease accessory protein UreD [Pseudomonas putida]MDH0637036.1 urease accessory protein UreD [Pseudomonas sp. GD03860]
MTLAQPLDLTAHSPGWSAELMLHFVRRGQKTCIGARRHFGPLLVQRPFYPEGAPCHVYVLHPPGGVVGGDKLVLDVHLAAGSHALLTMPGATKFYRSNGQTSTLNQHFHLAADSVLEWLPQGSICFPGARVRLENRFSLEPGARLLAWETLCLGRPVMSEPFSHGALDSRLQIDLPDDPGLHERLRIEGGQLQKLGGYPLQATFCAYPASEALLEHTRTLIHDLAMPAGATLLGQLLVVRLLDHDNQRLQLTLQRIWHALRPQVVGLAPCPPRIWAT